MEEENAVAVMSCTNGWRHVCVCVFAEPVKYIYVISYEGKKCWHY